MPLGYWLNTSSNTRHNSTCRYYENTAKGKTYTNDEGKACGICGGDKRSPFFPCQTGYLVKHTRLMKGQIPNVPQNSTILSVVMAFAIALSATSAPAAAITKNGLNNSTAFNTVDANLTATVGTNTGDGYSALGETEGTHWMYFTNTSTTNTATPTVGQIRFSFSLTPTSGYGITLNTTDSVTWDIGAYASSVDTSGGLIFYSKMFISDTSNFSNILATSLVYSVAASPNSTPVSNTNPTIGSSIANHTGPLYFGFAFGDNSSANYDKNGRLDNITVNGTISAIPEPSVSLLGGLGLHALLLRRRRS